MDRVVREWLALELQVIITNGGTGLTARDGTIEVARRLFDKELPGFGELFRWLSFQQIGSAAMLSRAVAGTAQGRLIICLPGSTKAVRLAMTRLIIPELPHLIWEIHR
jgi:molybdopterin adenylyltransferase